MAAKRRDENQTGQYERRWEMVRVIARLPQSPSQLDALILQAGVKELDKTPFDNLWNYLPEEKDFPFVPREANRALLFV